MDIVLYICNSEPNKIHKSLSGGETLDGVLRNNTSIVNPVIAVEFDGDIVDYNYVYIEAFSRYYYVSNITSIRNNIWELSLKVDVLMSFKNELSHCSAILEKSSEINSKSSPYIKTVSNVVLSKRKTDIISFSSGFNSDGEFILITAGGVPI